MKKATTKGVTWFGFLFLFCSYDFFACHVKYMWEFCLSAGFFFCYIVIRFARGVVGLVDLFGLLEILR